MRIHEWLTAALMMVSIPMAGATPLELPPKDYKNSKDHPLITRFNGAVILAYQTKDYDELVLPLGKFVAERGSTAERYERVQTVEGKLTRIAYGVPRGKTTLEIFRNYQQAIASAGFQTLFACSSNGCGNPYDFLDTLRSGLVYANVAYDNELNWMLNANGGELRHLSTVLRRPSGDVYATISVAQHPEQPPAVLVQIAEVQPMQANQVTVDARAIGSALSTEGKIALYGLVFDTDSATLAPESANTLSEMAKYLKSNATVKAYLVGHTDNTASIAHNLDLSQRRADAVAKALITQHGIAPARLATKGVASYAPAASNRDEAGRAKNRRVEMVEQ